MYREPDTSQHADPAEIEAALFGQAEPEGNGQPLRFSLWQLLTATTLAAALLALFRALGIWGAVFAFVAAAEMRFGSSARRLIRTIRPIS